MVDEKNATAEEKGKKKSAGIDPTDKIVKKYMWWSLGAGVLPMPLLDVGALAGIHLKMVSDLSNHYGVQFRKNRGKSIIAAMVGIITADGLRQGAFTSFVKAIPFLGFLGVISMPFYSSAVTYAIGRTFILHFESGGTLLDFDIRKIKGRFTKLVEEGKEAAYSLKTKKA